MAAVDQSGGMAAALRRAWSAAVSAAVDGRLGRRLVVERDARRLRAERPRSAQIARRAFGESFAANAVAVVVIRLVVDRQTDVHTFDALPIALLDQPVDVRKRSRREHFLDRRES